MKIYFLLSLFGQTLIIHRTIPTLGIRIAITIGIQESDIVQITAATIPTRMKAIPKSIYLRNFSMINLRIQIVSPNMNMSILFIEIATKKDTPYRVSFSIRCGNYLSFQGNETQVLSAQESLTSVFGMRTGGSSPLSSPQWLYKPLIAVYIHGSVRSVYPPLRTFFFSICLFSQAN